MSELSDEELMERYSNGSSDAFIELFDRYEKRLKGFYRKRLGPKQQNELEDFFQMTWLKIHNSRKNFDGSKKFSAWLYTIALNNLRDHIRSSYANSHQIEFDENEAFDKDYSYAEKTIIDREDFERISTGLQMLSEPQREIIILSDWEGFSSKEIGDILGLTDTAVRQQLSRSRKFLKEYLREALK